jgi:hypothetical protein
MCPAGRRGPEGPGPTTIEQPRCGAAIPTLGATGRYVIAARVTNPRWLRSKSMRITSQRTMRSYATPDGGKCNMKLPEISKPAGLSTTGLTGIVLMTLHITGYLTHWAWPILYVILILMGIGQENKKQK